MSDVLSFAEIEGQQVELLPARTVLSLFAPGGTTPGGSGAHGNGTGGGMGGSAGGASGGLSFNWLSGLGFGGTASSGHATGGSGGSGGNS